MKKPIVDYRKVRLSNITSPQYRHLLLLLGWVFYLVMYAVTERIPVEKCYPVWCKLDDIIPFNEWFVIPYVGWYLLIVVSLGYMLLYSVENFRRLQIFLIITQVLAIICYIAYPTRQDLRPTEFPRENILTTIMGCIYAVDTNTGVCPSMHVAFSIGMASAWLKEKTAAWYVRILVMIFAVLVCLSVTFTKQHSVVDIFAAIPICVIAELFAYGKFYEKKRKLKT